ncbi:MAG: class I SAM-dependent methyltransferase [Candidatus Puniceispirillales bacterium WSBS_2018_MAG_OTU23]
MVKPYAHENPFFDGSNISECLDCQMHFIDPMPSQAEWDEYNASYFTNAHGGINTSPRANLYHVGVAKVRMKALQDYLAAHDITVNTVLEIGPGQGCLMHEWLSQYPDTDYYVVESDDTTHGTLKARGGKLIDAEKIDTLSGVDVVIATHVIEHTLDPIGFLTHFCSVLRPGGGLFIEAPCKDYLYKDLYEPHVQFFDKKSFQICLDAANLSNIHLTYNGDRIPTLRRNMLIRKIMVKLERITKFPFRILLGHYWPDRQKFNLTTPEALEIVTTAPHIQQQKEARWLRGFGQKGS